jgi:hypothetical protein
MIHDLAVEVTMGEQFLSQAEASRRLGRHAGAIAQALYNGRLDGSQWPVLCGRRVVPAAELESIRRILATDRRRKTVPKTVRA